MNICSFSPDGHRILSGAGGRFDGGEVRVWDAKTGFAIITNAGHGPGVNACCFSCDGRQIVSGSYDNTLKLWDAETGTLTATMTGHDDWVLTCNYSPDGRRIVSGSEDGAVKFWDAETGQHLLDVTKHAAAIRFCEFSADGRWIATGSEDKTLKIWDAATGAMAGVFVMTARKLTCASMHPMRSSFVAGDEGGRLYFLRLVGLKLGPPIVTAVYLYRFDTHRWDADPTAKCKWCGSRFIPPPSVLSFIESATELEPTGQTSMLENLLRKFRSHATTFPDNVRPRNAISPELWLVSELVMDCPQCSKTLRLNPFVVDNRRR